MVVEADRIRGRARPGRMSTFALAENDGAAQYSPMVPIGNDRWRGEFSVQSMGQYEYTVEGWIDRFTTWRNDLIKRIAAGQATSGVELLIGAQAIEEVAARARQGDADLFRQFSLPQALRGKRRRVGEDCRS